MLTLLAITPTSFVSLYNQENSVSDLVENFITKNDRNIKIIIDDDGENICVKDMEGNEIGSIKLTRHEYQDDYFFHEWYKIVWMFLDKKDVAYLRQGIGRECLKFHKHVFQSPITAPDHDGHRQDDGSHLTGDAPGFIEQMRIEGLVVKSSEEYSHED